MGQPMPLPEPIPRPNDKLLTLMNESGITIAEETGKQYLEYTLPTG